MSQIDDNPRAPTTADELPLSKAEWSCLLDVLNNLGHFEDLEDSGFPSFRPHRNTIYQELHDGIGVNRVDEKHGVDGPALLEKIEAMSDAEAELIWDANYGFWQNPERGVIPGRGT
jgi:hypothetical protein